MNHYLFISTHQRCAHLDSNVVSRFQAQRSNIGRGKVQRETKDALSVFLGEGIHLREIVEGLGVF